MIQTKTIVQELVKKHGNNRESLIPVLQGIVEKNNYITDEDIIEIANVLDVSAGEIYGTTSFYTFLDTEKRGKYVIRVCKSIIAVMKGKAEIIKTIENILNIKVGETTPDNKFSLLEANDIGWSDKEPSMLINDKVYTELTPEKTTEIIESYLRD
ncbi:MAG: NAD(P)H-dependent oxidoreductase subunit E [Bacteroidales bacterium]|nr:NAD(P)H-dependent oxidoreductase subunit E [Bacteroidales bacterium]